MNFNEAVEIILAYEGGYSNDLRDPGGETNFGISKKAYPDVDIKNLTKEQAIAIYKRDYWDSCMIESLPDKLRLMVFDAAVNHGQMTACKFLQAVARTEQDGVIGRLTLGEINMMNPNNALKLYATQRVRAYAKSSNFQYYGAGWLARLVDILVKCLS